MSDKRIIELLPSDSISATDLLMYGPEDGSEERKISFADVAAGITIDVDHELSETSTNPVENKVITAAINHLGSEAAKHLPKQSPVYSGTLSADGCSALEVHAVAMGDGTTALGQWSHAEGLETKAAGNISHAEGFATTAQYSGHAEGYATYAGSAAHSEGTSTTAAGDSSHAGGDFCRADGENSFVHGRNLHANLDNQTVIGQYNTTAEDALFIVGNGYYNDVYEEYHYQNAMWVKSNGEVNADDFATTVNGQKVTLKTLATAAGGDYLDRVNPTGEGTLSLNSTAFTTPSTSRKRNILMNFNGSDSSLGTSSVSNKVDGNLILGSDFASTGNLTTVNVGGSFCGNILVSHSGELNASGQVVNTIISGDGLQVKDVTNIYGGIITGNNCHIGSSTTVRGELEGVDISGDNSTIDFAGTADSQYNHGIHVEGNNTSAIIRGNSEGLHAEGALCKVESPDIHGVHIEGNHTTATAEALNGVHVEGNYTSAVSGGTLRGVHIEGEQNRMTISSGGAGAHIEGDGNFAALAGDGLNLSGAYNFANVSGDGNHIGGYHTTAFGDANGLTVQGCYIQHNASHAYGFSARGYNISTFAENLYGGEIEGVGFGAPNRGVVNGGSHSGLHIEGVTNYFARESTAAASTGVHIEGYQNQFISSNNHAYGFHIEGYNSTATGDSYGAHVEGHSTHMSDGAGSHIEGEGTRSTAAWYSHIEGLNTSAYCTSAGQHLSAVHVEGVACVIASEGGNMSAGAHAEGWSSTATGRAAHSEGERTLSSGNQSHAEGYDTVASGFCAHAEGETCSAVRDGAHAEGQDNLASGVCAHAEGKGNIVPNDYAHASGRFNITNRVAQTVVGEFNAPSVDALFIVGNGQSTSSRANAFEVNADGSIKFFYNGVRYDLAQVLSALLTATTADAGKVLMVDANGEWTIGTITGGGVPLSMNFENSTITATSEVN